ncbi:hypothetical protein K469DRAFT_579204 [Zopfia rhizophila CBS 207.26]|uniref:Zn(2)-C6 fungal-type domain-containing protein n=1 Tax=Zopfia rhizophila CBS 207.26 TaxID=1314779 RepID=A0A6A6DYG3_9PEZI|nr:hypothetical protein K469DRAFT_579204 [Zopfia rhizophila CBS 207.26]
MDIATSQIHDLARATPEEPPPCRECRRRKAKCDGKVPVCSICQRYKRHCLYDKHSRTRLTRRHLTDLEERLERAEALLRNHFTDTQIAQMLGGAATTADANSQFTGTLPIDDPTKKSREEPIQPFEPVAAPALNSLSFSHVSNQESTTDTELFPSSIATGQKTWLDSFVGSEPMTGDPEPSFGSRPSTDDDFEWDERERSWSMCDPSSGPSIADGDGRNTQPIMDGMAALTVDDHNHGYLGAVSGAALLRFILSNDRNGTRVDVSGRQQRLEDLFRQGPAEDSGHSQWIRTQAMLTRVAVEHLIDAFFALYHPTFPIVHEPTFRAQYSNTAPRPSGDKWNILANIIAALGSFAATDPSDDTDIPIFQAVKKDLFVDYLEAGNLTLVQAFGLSANYLQKRNKPNSGYNYGGLALRLAIGIGLHKEFDGGKISALQMEIRRRVWWCLCVLDVGATVTYGRPLNWPQAGVETAMPRNIHEKDLTSPSTTFGQEVDGVTIYTYIRVQSAYHLRTMRIYNRLISAPFPPAAELIALDDELICGWLNEVPHYFGDDDFLPLRPEYALGHGISQWRFRNLRILMYRPFLIRWALGTSSCERSRSNAEDLAVSRCLDAAKESITSIQQFWTSRTHTRLAAWYVLYFLFQATLIPLHCLRQKPQNPLGRGWRTQIRSSLAVMDAMVDLNPNSSKCRDVTLRLCGANLYGEDEHLYSEIPTGLFGLTDDPSGWSTETDWTISGYEAWCELLSNASTGTSTYQAMSVDDWGLGFFP